MMNTVDNISFEAIPSIPKIVKDFLAGGFPNSASFVWSDENILNKIREKQNSYSDKSREILVETLSHQLSDLELTERQKQNWAVLSSKNSFTITTGHQLNLFSGPVFFIYKILQTIKSTKVLKEKFPKFNFVPIFWMATEDHDFEEIKSFKTKNSLFSIDEESGGAVGRIVIADTHFVEEFEKEFAGTPFGEELLIMMKSSYQKGKTLAEATRNLVHQLFSDYGLLILDGDEKLLKQQMIPVFSKELLDNSLFVESASMVENIIQQYGKAQVNPREINLFYLSETRNRIVFKNNKFEVLDTPISFSKEEILEELKKNPEKFSPNALLRPVFQETILPNIAYIGGNAEVAYWLELVRYFKAIQLPFPILVPRNSMLFVTEKTLSKMQKMPVSFQNLLKPSSDFINQKLLDNHPLSALIEKKEKDLSKLFNDLLKEAHLTDKSFAQMLMVEETRQSKSFDKMRKRLLKAEKIKNEEWLVRWNNLYETVHPNEIWQERIWNFSVFYAYLGKDWLSFCYQEMTVDNSELVISVANYF